MHLLSIGLAHLVHLWVYTVWIEACFQMSPLLDTVFLELHFLVNHGGQSALISLCFHLKTGQCKPGLCVTLFRMFKCHCIVIAQVWLKLRGHLRALSWRALTSLNRRAITVLWVWHSRVACKKVNEFAGKPNSQAFKSILNDIHGDGIRFSMHLFTRCCLYKAAYLHIKYSVRGSHWLSLRALALGILVPRSSAG